MAIGPNGDWSVPEAAQKAIRDFTVFTLVTWALLSINISSFQPTRLWIDNPQSQSNSNLSL